MTLPWESFRPGVSVDSPASMVQIREDTLVTFPKTRRAAAPLRSVERLMPSDLYRRLAETLNEIPNGFDVTESGLRLLAKLFTEDEASLASVMRLSFEPPSVIADRAGVDPEEAGVRLESMAGKGLVRRARRGGPASYGLMPFAVGIYEEALPRMDSELARLFEEYYEETEGGPMTHGRPALQRIIPVGKSIPVSLEIFPHEQASQYLENARSWGVRDCICRVQQKLVGKGCDNPIESCLVFAPVEGAFDRSEATRAISKSEALHILNEAAEAGLVHSTMNQKGQVFYICNCCTCCCGILRGVKEFGIPTAVARSDFRVTVDPGTCTGCGVCVERCQFGALDAEDGCCSADYARCVGCGVCVAGCPAGALRMERRHSGEDSETPANRRAWLVERAAARGVSLPDAEQ